MLTFDVNVNDDNFLTKKIAYYSRILVVRGTKYMGQVLVRSLFVKFSEFIKSFKSWKKVLKSYSPAIYVFSIAGSYLCGHPVLTLCNSPSPIWIEFLTDLG